MSGSSAQPHAGSAVCRLFVPLFIAFSIRPFIKSELNSDRQEREKKDEEEGEGGTGGETLNFKFCQWGQNGPSFFCL